MRHSFFNMAYNYPSQDTAPYQVHGLESLEIFDDAPVSSQQDLANAGTFAAIPWLQSLWGDITGSNNQRNAEQFEEYMYDKQNDYNLPIHQMQRLKDAGVNPNLAAAGIAGAGSISQPAPSSPNSGASNPISEIAGLAQTANDIKRQNVLLPQEEGKYKAEIVEILERAGMEHWNALSTAELLPTMKSNQRADYYLKLANIKESSARYNKLVAEHDSIMKSIDVMDEQIELYKAQGQEALAKATEANKNAALIEENTRFQKATNDFWENEGFDRNSPLDQSLRNSIVNGKVENAEKIGNAIEESEKRKYSGQYQAENDALWDKKFIEEMFYHPKNLFESISYTRKRIGLKLREYANDISDTKKAIKLKRYTRQAISDLEEEMDGLDPNSSEYKNCQAIKESFEKDLKLSSKEMLKLYSQDN